LSVYTVDNGAIEFLTDLIILHRDKDFIYLPVTPCRNLYAWMRYVIWTSTSSPATRVTAGGHFSNTSSLVSL